MNAPDQSPAPSPQAQGSTNRGGPLQTLRSSVRPLATLGVVATAIVLAVWEAWHTSKAPEWFLTQLGVIIGFWFASREIQNAR